MIDQTDTLRLPGWAVLSVNDADTFDIEAEYTIEPEACQRCGVIGRLYRHGTSPLVLRDSPVRLKPTHILVSVRRYKCRECGGTFLQPLGGIYPDTRMTARCVQHIKELCLRDTFVRVAALFGCDDKTVRKLASEHIETLNAGYQPYLPEWLGLDETQIDGVQRCVITDVGNRRPIDMLADREKPTVITWLHHFRDRGVVRGLAIDMWRPYRDAARVVFPDLPVVVDKFHIVRTANYCMEKVRVRLGKSQEAGQRREWMRSKHLLNMRPASLTEKQRFALDMWLDNDAEMAAAYHLKEAFYRIYDLPKAEAIEAYDAYAASVPKHLKADFKTLLTSMRNWRSEILAFFDYPITNGYTEALNGVAKVINRSGRGYSFDVLRARVLFGTSSTLPRRKAKKKLNPERTVKQMLASRNDCRCDSCGGTFLLEHLEATPIPALTSSQEPVRLALVCEFCRDRFHTLSGFQHESTSTT